MAKRISARDANSQTGVVQDSQEITGRDYTDSSGNIHRGIEMALLGDQAPYIPLDWDDSQLSEASTTDTWTYRKSAVDIATVVITYSSTLKEKVTRVQRTLL